MIKCLTLWFYNNDNPWHSDIMWIIAYVSIGVKQILLVHGLWWWLTTISAFIVHFCVEIVKFLLAMLRRRGTYTVNADAGIQNGQSKAAELITIVTKRNGMFLLSILLYKNKITLSMNKCALSGTYFLKSG